MTEDNRGRTQIPKPRTTPAPPTRVKSESRALVSAAAPAEKQPTASSPALSPSTSATTKSKKIVTQSRPIKTPCLIREPLPEPVANDTSESITPPEDVPTIAKPAGDAEGASSAPVSEPEALETSETTKPLTPSQSEAAPPPDSPPADDPLQVAAHAYPWLYMSSTLDMCFSNEDKKGTDGPEKPVTEDQAQFEDGKLQYDGEKVIEFRDEIGSDTFAKEAPIIMRSFTTFGEVCERVEAEALQLAMSTPSLESREPLQAFRAMMDNLNNLQEQASELESSILRLTSSNSTAQPSTQEVPETLSSATNSSGENEPEAGEEEDKEAKRKLLDDANSARAQMMGVFIACLPVLRARIANLSMAQELIDSAQENFSLTLRMESMGIE